jgi:hypothetical protein
VSERGYMTEAEISDILKENFTYSQIHNAIDCLMENDIIRPCGYGYKYSE